MARLRIGLVWDDAAGKCGRSDCGFQGLAVTFEEAGRTLAATPLLSTVVLGAGLIEKLGTPEQQRAILSRLLTAAGCSLALDELPRHQPTHLSTIALEDGDGFTNGSKTFVFDGHVADELLLRVRAHNRKLSGFRGTQSGEGLEVTRTWMVDSRNAANMTMNNVRASAGARLGDGRCGWALDAVLDRGRIALAAEMLGSATEAFERTAYLKMRSSLACSSALFRRKAPRGNMFNELELTRSAVYAAASAVDEAAMTWRRSYHLPNHKPARL